MTVSHRPTQDQDPQERGSQHNGGAAPTDGIEQPATTPRLSEPIWHKVVVRPTTTPPPGMRFSGQESQGQQQSSLQKQEMEQLPTSALPSMPTPLTSNRAQTIEQL